MLHCYQFMGCTKLITLAQLTGYLDSLTPKHFAGADVQNMLASSLVEFDELSPFIYFREDTYGRNLICRKKYYELLVLSWLPNQATPVHNHNGQRCWMWIHSGKLTFRNYRREGREALQSTGPDQVYHPGDLTYIDDKIGLHEILNLSGKPAVSLHLYANPISQCQVYNPESKSFEWLELTAFNHQESSEEPPPPESPEPGAATH